MHNGTILLHVGILKQRSSIATSMSDGGHQTLEGDTSAWFESLNFEEPIPKGYTSICALRNRCHQKRGDTRVLELGSGLLAEHDLAAFAEPCGHVPEGSDQECLWLGLQAPLACVTVQLPGLHLRCSRETQLI